MPRLRRGRRRRYPFQVNSPPFICDHAVVLKFPHPRLLFTWLLGLSASAAGELSSGPAPLHFALRASEFETNGDFDLHSPIIIMLSLAGAALSFNVQTPFRSVHQRASAPTMTSGEEVLLSRFGGRACAKRCLSACGTPCGCLLACGSLRAGVARWPATPRAVVRSHAHHRPLGQACRRRT